MTIANANANALSEEALRRVEPSLRAFALRSVRLPHVADDLVQDTYVAALSTAATFEGRSQLKTWLVAILARKIADHFRRGGREIVVEEMPEPDQPPANDQAEAEQRLDQQRALSLVEQQLETLPELERRAIQLCDIERRDRRRVADSLGIRDDHLRVLLHRGRRKLRRALEAADLQPA